MENSQTKMMSILLFMTLTEFRDTVACKEKQKLRHKLAKTEQKYKYEQYNVLNLLKNLLNN